MSLVSDKADELNLVPCPVCLGTKTSQYSPHPCTRCLGEDGQPTGTITEELANRLKAIGADIRERAAQLGVDLGDMG